MIKIRVDLKNSNRKEVERLINILKKNGIKVIYEYIQSNTESITYSISFLEKDTDYIDKIEFENKELKKEIKKRTKLGRPSKELLNNGRRITCSDIYILISNGWKNKRIMEYFGIAEATYYRRLRRHGGRKNIKESPEPF